MTCNRLIELIPNEVEMVQNIKAFGISEIEVPYLMQEILKLLDDEHAESRLVSDNDLVVLAYMFSEYKAKCFSQFDYITKNPKLIDYARYLAYKVEADNGIRFATKNEVEDGVECLLKYYIYPAGEEAATQLYMLYWTVYGKPYQFRGAGYKLEYNDKGEVVTSSYQMIQMAYRGIKDVIDWVTEEKGYNLALKKIKKFKSNGGYKYATYEKDEIRENITVKQLIKTLEQHVPRKSDNTDYRRALWIILSHKSNGTSPTPLEISELRRIYKIYCDDFRKNGIVGVNEELKELCNRIENGVVQKLLSPTHFLLKIVSTIKKYGYTRCSQKQLNILKEAEGIITKKSQETNQTVVSSVITDDAINDTLSNTFERMEGLFEEGDDE